MKAEGIRLPTVDRSLIEGLSIHATDTADMVGARRGPGGQRIGVVSKGRLCHGPILPARSGHREAGIRLPRRGTRSREDQRLNGKLRGCLVTAVRSASRVQRAATKAAERPHTWVYVDVSPTPVAVMRGAASRTSGYETVPEADPRPRHGEASVPRPRGRCPSSGEEHPAGGALTPPCGTRGREGRPRDVTTRTHPRPTRFPPTGKPLPATLSGYRLRPLVPAINMRGYRRIRAARTRPPVRPTPWFPVPEESRRCVDSPVVPAESYW